MNPTCPRLFEVEALRNGRLTGGEQTSFERHLTRCAACSEEAKALAALGTALRASERAGTDQLHVRRERTRLLAAFDRALTSERRPTRVWRGLATLAAAAALAGGAFLFWRGSPPLLPVPVSNLVVDGGRGALWSRRAEGPRDVVELEHGEVRIRVGDGPGKRPLLVLLPDGELEDRGTIFSLAVEAGRTTRVHVEEGSVTLRIRGERAIAIGASTTWTAVPEPTAPASAAPRVAPDPVLEVPPQARSLVPAAAASAPSTAASAFAQASHASEEFRVAVAAFNRGEHLDAAARFARFLERHPRDPRAEDAAYLRVLSLRKAGSGSAMNSAALDYLRRYPSGFRRSEVEGVTR